MPAAGIDFFQGHWREAFEAAERGDKAVFVDVYTQWCGPCKLMDANVYPDVAAGAYFNARFVNVKLDAEDEAIDGPAFAKRYDIGGYPTLLFLRPDGTEIGRGVAGLGVEQLLRLAAELTARRTATSPHCSPSTTPASAAWPSFEHCCALDSSKARGHSRISMPVWRTATA